MTARTAKLSAAGVSIWLDDLSRDRIDSGNLVELMETRNVVGVTTNPSIFAAAIGSGTGYATRIAECASRGLNARQTVAELTIADVADACQILAPLYAQSEGRDGRVSIEVDPHLARDTEATIAQAQELWARVGQPNVMVKIPATEEGLAAITETIAAGISVNVTLIFSIVRYREVVNAYLAGLERARAGGKDLSAIHSVASFFVSRLDTEVDARLRAIGTEEAVALTGQAGIANSRLAYEIWQQAFATERAKLLLGQGANVQRLLWASTGVKDPVLPDTLYVTELVAPQVVNTMPEATLHAVADHAEIVGDTVSDGFREADLVLNGLDAHGIEYAEVVAQLEVEGLRKFDDAWDDLLTRVDAALGESA